MNNSDRKFKKMFFIILLISLLFFCGFGIYSYYKFSQQITVNTISVSKGKLYPEFSTDVNEYQLYTDLDEITINCELNRGYVDGCNEKVLLNDKITEHSIITKKNKYIVKIVKQDTEYSEVLKVGAVNGVPTTWVRSATITANVKKLGNVEGIVYSFDGGSTWQNENSITLKSNAKLNIKVKDYFGYVSEDKEVIVDKIDNDKPSVVVSKSILSKGKILLTATAKDGTSGIGGYSWNGKGYSTSNTITVDKSGNYKVVVKDKVGNESKAASIAVTEDDLRKSLLNEYVILFDSNGADSISREFLKCTTEGKSCSVTLPSIVRKNYNILGWSKSSNSTEAEYKMGSSIRITGGEKLYAITSRKLTATFEKNGSSSISSSSLSCNIYNKQTGCSVKAPTISRIGYNVLGWAKNKNGKKAQYKVGNNIKLIGSDRYYAITSKTIVATFNKNGAYSISDSGVSCNLYNKESMCMVKSPTITASSGFEVVGWGSSASSTKKTASVGQSISLSKNTKYYAITKSKDAYKVTLNKNGASKVGESGLSCYRYNGSSKCNVKLPTITAASGFEVIGWGSSASSMKKTASVGQSVSLSKDVKYYAITKSATDYKATFYPRVASIGSYNVGTGVIYNCYRYNGGSTCTVKTPSVNVSSGQQFLGWNTDSGATSASIKSEQSISLKSNTNYYAVVSEKLTATFNKNGASSIGSSSLTCYKYNGGSSCSVTLPTITAASGFEVVGWGSSASSTTKSASVGQSVSISKNTTYYAVTKSKDAYKVTFNKNGASSIGATSLICYRYNNASSCTVKLPTITAASGFEVVGWGSSASSTTKSASVGQSVSLSKDAKYYAITKSATDYKVTFRPRTASIGSHSVGTGIVPSCYRYNGASSCNVTTPSVNLSSGQTFLGWSTNANATSSTIKDNQTVSVKKDVTYYAIVKEKLTATFNKNGADSLSFYNTSCISYGAGCLLTDAPLIYKKGHETWGGFSFGSPSNSANGVINKKITSNTSLYAKQVIWTGHPTSLAISKSYKINGISIDVEKTNNLPYSVYNKYYNLLNESVYKNMPYLFDYKGKIRMVSYNTYVQKLWSKGSAGVTYGYGNEYSNIDMRLDNSYSEYSFGSIVHELGHAFDYYYGVKTGKALNAQSDVVELYNKYKKMSSSNRPLRDYAYTNEKEFVAESIEYYYYYKYSNVTCPNGGNKITSDIIKVFEKYFKIAKNGYK